MLKFGCMLPNLTNIFLHKSTDIKFYPSTEANEDLLDKILLVVLLAFSNPKQLLTKLLFEGLQS